MTITELPLSLLLRADSERAESSVEPPLRPHQEAALARCRAIETRQHDIGMIRDLSPDFEYSDLKSRIGTICDSTGSGKSLVVIALCADACDVATPVRYVSHCNGLMSYTVRSMDFRRVQTSVIVVPHGILRQWIGYLRASGVGFYVVEYQTPGGRRALEAKLNARDCPPIVLCTDTNYRMVTSVFESNGLCADRLVIDEADTIPLGHSPLIEACMYWTVTASVPNVLNPKGGAIYYTFDGSWAMCDRVKCTAVRRIWHTLEEYAKETRAMLLVRSSDDFVRASLALASYQMHDVLCRAPPGTAVLCHLGDRVDRAVMQALNTDDVELALSLLPNRDSADNIVANVRAGWRDAIDAARIDIAKLSDVSEPRVQELVRSMEREAQTYEKSIEALDERVRGEQVCAICYEQPVGRTILTCCSSVYCVKCVATWLNKNATCPYCRARTCFEVDAKVVGAEADVNRMLSKTESVERLVKAILDGDASRRVILACSNNGLGRTLQRPFAAYGISVLKGTGASIAKSVREFQEGKTRVMFMSDDCYCTGINLPFVTDVVLFHRTTGTMEDQIIGRAQRPGRTTRLQVWRMVHAGEQGVDTAGSLEAALQSLTYRDEY
jgi:Ring finger domain